MSLQQAAEQIRAAARQAAEAAGDVEARARTQTVLTQLDAELVKVRALLEVMDALADAGVCAPVDRALFRRGGERLLRDIEATGRPSPNQLQGALKALRNLYEKQEHSAHEAWEDWSQEQFSALPTEKRALLTSPSDQAKARTYEKTLRDATRGLPSARGFSDFQQTCRDLAVLLDSAQADPILHRALQRLEGQPPPSLADFPDEELAALRAEPSISRSITLGRRRG